MGNSSYDISRPVLILSIIILSIISGCVLAENNGEITGDLNSNINGGKIVYITFIADIRTINTDEITCYDSMINQINEYLGFSTNDIRVRSVLLIDSFISSTYVHEMEQYTGENISCDIVIDETIRKSKKCALLTIQIHIKKFPSTICKTDDCQNKYIADIKGTIRSRYVYPQMLTLQMPENENRSVSAQFCYFGRSTTVTENQANKCLCSIGTNLTNGSSINNNSTSGIQNFLTTFGFGTNQYSNKTPADFGFTSGHTQVFSGAPGDGYFTIVNAIPEFLFWHTGGLDHTVNETGGYMYVLNALLYPGLYFNKTINNLSIGKVYEFSTYVANVNKPSWSPPNIIFQVRTATPDNILIAERSSGNIPEYNNFTWNKYGISFVAPSTSVVLLMISNGTSSAGNDVALDDIGLCEC